MPYIVYGEVVTEELIRQESQSVSRDLLWQTIADEAERARRLREAAERSAIDRMLIAFAAAADPRPVDPERAGAGGAANSSPARLPQPTR